MFNCISNVSFAMRWSEHGRKCHNTSTGKGKRLVPYYIQPYRYHPSADPDADWA